MHVCLIPDPARTQQKPGIVGLLHVPLRRRPGSHAMTHGPRDAPPRSSTWRWRPSFHFSLIVVFSSRPLIISGEPPSMGSASLQHLCNLYFESVWLRWLLLNIFSASSDSNWSTNYFVMESVCMDNFFPRSNDNEKGQSFRFPLVWGL